MLSEFGFTEDKIRLIYKGIASDLFQIRFKFVSDLLQIRSEIHFKFQTSS